MLIGFPEAHTEEVMAWVPAIVDVQPNAGVTFPKLVEQGAVPSSVSPVGEASLNDHLRKAEVLGVHMMRPLRRRRTS